jgi:MATE family multidrug resistance protein
MVLTGVSSAGTIMIGYAYGAKDKEAIRISGNTVFLLTIATEIVFAIFFLTFSGVLPRLYTTNPEVLGIATSMLFFAAVFQISDGMQSVAAGALRGMQDVTYPAVIAFVCYWLVMMPACYFLGFYYNYGLKGIWIGFIIGLTLAAIMQLLRFWYVLRKLRFDDNT